MAEIEPDKILDLALPNPDLAICSGELVTRYVTEVIPVVRHTTGETKDEQRILTKKLFGRDYGREYRTRA